MEYFLSVLLAMTIGVAVGVGHYLSEMQERREQPKEMAHFQENLHKAISKTTVTWEHIKLLARHHSVTSFGLKKTLDALASRAVVSEQEDKGVLDRIQAFLQALEAEEPFQGLPDELQLHLRQIQEKLSGDNHLLQPLARHLRELLEERSASQRRQRLVNYLSLAVGLIGIFVGISCYWI